MNGTLPRRVTSKPLKVRTYTHFDLPLTEEALADFKVTPEQVATHSFFPLLGYQKKERRIDFDDDDFLTIVEKPRDIRYAGHVDSAIYGSYARTLSTIYDQFLHDRGLSDSVLAYRGDIGSNIDFSTSFFDEIRHRGDCHVVCLDVSKFFDNLRHDILKDRLSAMLGEKRLPSDWFKIYQRLTSYEYVLGEKLEETIGKFKPPRICDIATFRSIGRPLIETHDKPHGIPQGTPLSGILANIYMADFDVAMSEVMSGFGGSYRRYSDDIAIVFPHERFSPQVIETMEDALEKHGLRVNPNKTARTTFSTTAGTQNASGDDCQYLGFTFDGTRVLIRSSSMRRFYSRMKRNLNRYVKAAAAKGIPANELRKRVLVGKFTHWGSGRNFVRYAYQASRRMKSPEIKRQLRNHVRIFDAQWDRMIEKWYRPSPPA